MYASLLLLLPGTASAASLDNLEIGGVWGSPTATDATAVWWNPAALAAGKGTRIELEGAPTFATVTYERNDPHGGSNIYRLNGLIPYAGVATDVGVKGLGLGLGLAVPYARGATADDESGPGAYTMRDGLSQGIYGMVGAAYQIKDRVAIGATASLVRTQWTARIDNDTMPDLAHAIEQEGGTVDYTDDDLEDPNYAAQLQFSDLTATKFSFSAGLHVKITPQVSVGVAYVHGAYVQNTGDASITFSCPPQSDRLARLGAERLGICYADTTADATIGYTLPDRVHGGIAWEPTDHARIEAMGGWVGWSVYDNFEVGVHNVDLAEDDAKDLVEQDRLWALDNKDTFWAGVDGKGRLGDKWTLGGRLLYDHSAVPDSTLSVNNYDANDWMVSGLVAFRPVSRFEVGLSWTHHFLETRDVAESAYGQTVVYEERKEDRYFYPHTDGKYGGVVDRAGIAVRAYF